MKCSKCGFVGHPIRTIVLTCKIKTTDKGKPISKYLKQSDMPYRSFKKWVLSECDTQAVELFNCANCDEEIDFDTDKNRIMRSD